MLICPECETTWVHHRGSMEMLTKMASQIAKLAEMDGPKNEAPFIVRFEVKPEQKCTVKQFEREFPTDDACLEYVEERRGNGFLLHP